MTGNLNDKRLRFSQARHYYKVAGKQALLIFMACVLVIITARSVSAQCSTLQDKDGNVYTSKIFAGGKTWLTINLAVNISGSYCYENSAENCKKYGRLYTWEAAKQGCSMLGEGWRLPSRDEWLSLAAPFGGVFGNSADSGRSAYNALLYGGSSGFNALLGGGRDMTGDKYGRLEAHGFYWTSTDGKEASAWFGNFGKGSKRLFCQNDGEKDGAFAVRCIRDAK